METVPSPIPEELSSRTGEDEKICSTSLDGSICDDEDQGSVDTEYYSEGGTEGTSVQSSDRGQDEEEGWETDLEIEDVRPNYDISLTRLYQETCKELGVVPASYFMRHMNSPSLSMRYHGLGPLGAKAMAVSLVSNTHILSLDLEDNWLEADGGNHIAEMLKENCYISELNLNGNRLGSAGAGSICEMLMYNTTLTKLYLSGNMFQDRDAPIFTEALLDNTTLMELDLSHNGFGDGSAILLGHAISENGDLHVLDLSWNNFRLQAAVEIIDGVKTNTRLKRVNLSWNGIGNEASRALGDCLRHNAVLLELDVSSNRIGTEGIALVARGLDYNETLKVLKIGNNPLGSNGAMCLLHAINNDRSVLKELNIEGVLVDKEFTTLHEEITQSREVKVIHGGILGNYVIKGIYRQKRPPEEDSGINLEEVLLDMGAFLQCDPLSLVKEFLQTYKERSLSLLAQLDQDKQLKITGADLKKTLREIDAGLNEEQIDDLMSRLDKTDKDDVDYSLFLTEDDIRTLRGGET